MTRIDKTILALSLPLALLVSLAGLAGLLSPGFYAAETPNWQAQSLGQDLIDVCLVVPCLLVTAIAAARHHRAARLMWGGVVFYLCYTLVLYCFQVHFNSLFWVYCTGLGLSFYAALYFLFTVRRYTVSPGHTNKGVFRVTAVYFMVVSVFFYILWLMEVVPALLHHNIPKSVAGAGLFTNGVQVLDLGIFLPGVFLTAMLLLRKSEWGQVLAPALLMFFVLMDLTIGALAVVMKYRGIESSLVLTGLMGVLAAWSLVLLIRFLKQSTGE
ncbi:MAG: hypothetical protein JST26_09605 [Bacteroidetes bacterium]|nr:hypothetical protein [Bacteroidota bacterium]